LGAHSSKMTGETNNGVMATIVLFTVCCFTCCLFELLSPMKGIAVIHPEFRSQCNWEGYLLIQNQGLTREFFDANRTWRRMEFIA
jgi:hypothetical protein